MRENIRYLAADINHPFVVEMAGISHCDSSYRIIRDKSTIWVFEYIIAGSGKVREQDKNFVAQRGDVYILHRNRKHDYSSDAQDPWTKIWFNIKGPVVENLIKSYGMDAVNLVPGCSAEIESLFRRFLAETYKNDSLYEIFDKCSLVFHEILHKLSSQHPRQKIWGEAEILHDFIMRSLTVPVGLEDIAGQIFRSKAYVIKIFRAAYGQTPYAYLVNRRIEAARYLLRETRMSVSEISDQFCFADQHYFANVFRQSIGMSPRQYRKSSAAKEYNTDRKGKISPSN